MNINFKSCAQVLLLMAVGILIYYPSLDVMPYISEGDIGRDLYAYEMTLEGKIPYRDYFYNYGPLMPYYYALFFKAFGFKISSILLGRVILNLICGWLIFESLRLFFRPLAAMLGTWWYWSFNQDFTFTFNHTGGVCLLLLIIYCLLQRTIQPKPFTTGVIVAALFLLLLVKLNIGLAALLATGISYVLINTMHGKGKFHS